MLVASAGMQMSCTDLESSLRDPQFGHVGMELEGEQSSEEPQAERSGEVAVCQSCPA